MNFVTKIIITVKRHVNVAWALPLQIKTVGSQKLTGRTRADQTDVGRVSFADRTDKDSNADSYIPEGSQMLTKQIEMRTRLTTIL